MSLELLSLLGGSVAGFVFKLIASQAEAQQRQTELLIKRQEVFDNSADRAANRGGVLVRRVIAFSVLFAVILAPFILAFFSEIPVSVLQEPSGILGWLGITGEKWVEVKGMVMLPEVRTSMLSILGFYFGSSQVSR